MGTNIKYYKLIGDGYVLYKKNVIYPETYGQNEKYASVGKCVDRLSRDWREVTLKDYIDQEGGWHIRGSEEFQRFVEENNINKNNYGCDFTCLFYGIDDTGVYSKYHDQDLNGIEININQLKELYNMSEESTVRTSNFVVKVTPTTSKILQELAFDNGWTKGVTQSPTKYNQQNLYFKPENKDIYYLTTKEKYYTQLSLEEAIERIEEKKSIKIGQYEVEFDDFDKVITVGCKKYTYKYIERLSNILSVGVIEAIQIGDYEISYKTIKQIYDRTL